MNVPLTDWSGPRYIAKNSLLDKAKEIIEKRNKIKRPDILQHVAEETGISIMTANAFLSSRTVSENSAILIHKWIENANA